MKFKLILLIIIYIIFYNETIFACALCSPAPVKSKTQTGLKSYGKYEFSIEKKDGEFLPDHKVKIENSLKKLKEIKKADLNSKTKKLVIIAEKNIDVKKIVKNIEKAGPFSVKDVQFKVKIEGMTCSECVSTIEKSVEKEKCFKKIDINLKKAEAVVICNLKDDPGKCVNAITKSGFKAYIINQ